MRSFPYKPRPPRVPPEAPEPETPQQSDLRLVGHMVRIALTAFILVASYGVATANGAARGIAGICILVGSILTAVDPDFRAGVSRVWFWYRWPGMWWWESPEDDDS